MVKLHHTYFDRVVLDFIQLVGITNGIDKGA